MTYACTGRCRHCSEGDHASCGERIDPQIAADAANADIECDEQTHTFKYTCLICDHELSEEKKMPRHEEYYIPNAYGREGLEIKKDEDGNYVLKVYYVYFCRECGERVESKPNT